MTGELLLELLTEEIPARMQGMAVTGLTGLIGQNLMRAQTPATTIIGHVTPRRLVVIAEGISIRQSDREEERRGPRVGAPEAAINGFLRGAGLTSIEQCEVRATDRGEFYFAVIKQPGRATAEVLPELILAAMTALPWPKSMRYPASALRWVRPLNSVICLFDGEVIKLDLGEVPVGRVTRGHRFLSPGEIEVANAADYRAKLAEAYVVLDQSERRSKIETGLKEELAGTDLLLKDDQDLLTEVMGLVEYPVPLIGSIDADFVRPLPEGLPPEVLATAMRTHQRYFTCLNADGTPAPRFLFVANNVTQDDGKTITAGNERVLRARLSDARFFWDQDRKIPLEDRVEALKQRVYHEKLGSVYDKVERMEKLAEHLAQFVPGADPSLCRRAARLAKADLSTGMVGEFPELQGIMGRYYVFNDGEDPRIADAIADHYKPLGPTDSVPTAPESIVVALADKIDALFGFFWIDEKPSGSRDPFALRRAALGLIRIILERKLRLPLRDSFGAVHKIFVADQVASTLLTGEKRYSGVGPFVSDVGPELLDFVAERLKVHLREEGVPHDLISAVFAGAEDDLVRLIARVDALQKFLATDDGSNLLVAYRRASNIVTIENRKDGPHDGEVDAALLQQNEERSLASFLSLDKTLIRDLLKDEDFEGAMGLLAQLRRPVDDFFDAVTVNSQELELRHNRLRLLTQIRATMNQVADFSQIEG
jgi:glycyl-tRNA synthetase beta chain